MKKIIVFLALFAVVMGGAGLFSQDRLTVDLNALSAKRNTAAFTKNRDDFLVRFPAFPDNINFSQYTRLIVRIKYFDAGNNEISQDDGQAMATLIYDPSGDIRGPENGPGPNTPLKTFNIGGPSSSISRDTGMVLRINSAPAAILFQNTSINVKYIEISEITFIKR